MGRKQRNEINERMRQVRVHTGAVTHKAHAESFRAAYVVTPKHVLVTDGVRDGQFVSAEA